MILGRGVYGSADWIHLPRSFKIIRRSFPSSERLRRLLYPSAVDSNKCNVFFEFNVIFIFQRIYKTTENEQNSLINSVK